jgi:two-component system, OmpR family, sensor histidine kinase TctE
MADGFMQSIRARVTLAAVLLLGLFSLALLALAWGSARRAADAAFDRVIGASALSIADGIRIDNDRITVELPQAALAMIGLASEARVFYRVTDAAGASIAGHVTLGLELPAARDTEPDFFDGVFRGAPVRFAVTGRNVDNGLATVIVAETTESREALARRIFLPSLVAVAAVALIALALILFGLRRAFSPFDLIESELKRRTPSDLQPIGAPAPREVRGLVTALNDFMARLESTLDRFRNYAGHAAHEVRTPIAAIRAQATAALSEKSLAATRRRLARIENNAEAAGQVVNQILLDASVQHRLGTQAATAVDLMALCREVVERLDPLLQPAVRLNAPSEGEAACLVAGDPVAIREAVRNLVDNALKYAPTGLVEITLHRSPDGWQADVADRGPGIPAGSMAAMTERFSRGPEAGGVAGAGLGLHIVRQVAEAYGGRLELANRPEGGLSARLNLRAAAVALLAFASGLAMVAAPAIAQPAPALRILASTDMGLLEPLLEGFRAARPDIAVAIERVDSQLAFTRIQSQAAAGEGPDLVIGHATDILVEMVNDGFARALPAAVAQLAPDWANWRRELISVGLDQGVFVYRRSAFEGEATPRSRAELIRLLDRMGERLRGRIGALDVGNNGVAYLLASQEARLSTSYWRLIRAFGSVEARIYWSTAEMIAAFRRGEIDMAYNAVATELGPLRGDAAFAILTCDDVQLLFPRAALIPRLGRAADAAHAFLRFSLSPQGQAIVAAAGAVPVNPPPVPATQGDREPPRQRVSLGPGLLALRDLNTRSTLMETWLQIMLTR